MKKILIIAGCVDCPHFNYAYPDYARYCYKLSKKTHSDDNYNTKIPEDCPLETFEESGNE